MLRQPGTCMCALGVCGGAGRRARPAPDAACDFYDEPRVRREFAVGEGTAHDLDTLLYAFLNELLFCFLTEMFVCKELRVARLQRGPAWTISAVGCAAGLCLPAV